MNVRERDNYESDSGVIRTARLPDRQPVQRKDHRKQRQSMSSSNGQLCLRQELGSVCVNWQGVLRKAELLRTLRICDSAADTGSDGRRPHGDVTSVYTPRSSNKMLPGEKPRLHPFGRPCCAIT